MVSHLINAALFMLLTLFAAETPARADLTIERDLANDVQNGRLWIEGNELKIEAPAAGNAEKITTSVPLIQVKKGERYFHWTTPDNVERWRAQGHIDAGEMAFLSRPTGDRQVYGPGFYVSSDPLDSSGYGPAGIMSEIKEDFYLLPQKIASEDPAVSKMLHDKLRALKIFGNNARRTWNVLFDERAVTQLRPLDAKLILDHYAATNPAAMTPTEALHGLSIKFKLVPHPLIAASHPGLQKALLGQALAPEEEKVLIKDLAYYDNLRAIVAERIPPARLQKYLLEDAPTSGTDSIRALLEIDAATGGLRSGPELRKLNPRFADLAEGKQLSAEARLALWRDLADEHTGTLKYGLTDFRPGVETPFLRKLKNEFAPELRDGFRKLVAHNENAAAWISAARTWGVRLSDVLPGERDPGGTPLTRGPRAAVPAQLAKLDDYGRKLAESFAIIDHYDLAREVAKGNPEPWRLYDEPGKEPLLDRWKKALNSANNGSDVFDTYALLFGEKKDFRGKRVVAGGDVRIPGDPFGYARMTQEQVAALKDNPLLTIYEKEDPYPQHRGKRTSLIRYEYPSAATFETFQDRISSSLLASLRKAKQAGELASEGSETFQKLTREILRELWQNTYYGGSPIKNYQARVSVHPFEDYNGRVARLFYQAESSGKPLVMQQWDLDLLTRPETLVAHQDKGDDAYAKILNSLIDRKAEAPQFPRYFDSPEIFETLLDLPPDGNAARRAKHVAAVKDFLVSPAAGSMIAQKEITQLQWKLWDLEGAEWAKLPESERTSVLKKWMSNGFVPEFSDDRLFRRMLDESKRLARGKDEARLMRWWLQIGAGLDPVHAPALAEFVRSLPEGLGKSFRNEWVRGENVLNLPFRAEERGAWEGELKSILAGASDAGIDEATRARQYIQQELHYPADPKRPFAGILRIGHRNHPAFNTALLQIIQSPGNPKRVAALEAAIQLPAEVLRELASTLTPYLLHAGSSVPGFKASLTKAMLQEGNPIGETAFNLFAQGSYSANEYLDNPRFRKRFLARGNLMPPANGIDDRLSLAALSPERAKAALQSFQDRKEWNSFLRLAELTADPQLTAAKASPAQKALLKQIQSGLPKADEGLKGGRALAVEIIREKINPPSAGAKSKIQDSLLKALREKNAFLPQDLLALVQSPEGKAQLAELLDTLMVPGKQEAAELIKRGSMDALSRINWKPAWDESLKSIMNRASLEEQVAITKNLAQSHYWKDQAVFALKQLGPEGQAIVIAGGRLPSSAVFSYVASDDERVREAATKILFPYEKDPAAHADLARRLLTKGPVALMDKPLPLEWQRTVESFLNHGVSRELKHETRDAIVAEIYRSGSMVPRTAEEVSGLTAMRLQLEDWAEPDDKVGAFFVEKMDAVLNGELPGDLRKAAMEEFRKIGTISKSFRTAMDEEKFFKLYLKHRDEALLAILFEKAERAPRSEVFKKVYAEGLQSPEASLRFSASRNLRNILGDVTATDADRALVKKAVQNALDASYLRNPKTFREPNSFAMLDELGRAAGLDAEAYAQNLSAGLVSQRAGAQGLTCSFHFNRLKLK